MSSRLILAVACLWTWSSCGSASQVERDARGGTIAIHGERHESMKEAREMMLDHCRGPYQIIEEGQMKVEGSSRREWRLRYRCDQTPRQAVEPEGQLPPSPDDGYPQAPSPPDPIDAGAAEPSADAAPSASTNPDPEE